MAKPLILIILDGWGIRNAKKGNAIKLAHTPNLDTLWKTNAHTTLKASGEAVGLPKGFMGNSEVGHMTIGAGRIMESDLVRINTAIKNKSFFKNKTLINAAKHVKKKKSALHIIGLLSDKGVHSHINHVFALIDFAKKQNIKQVYIHAFLDGRDSPPKSAKKYLQQLKKKLKQEKLATIMGRYYAMDRDKRWARTKKAFNCFVNLKGNKKTSIDKYYKKNITDEFIPPTIITPAKIKRNDAVIFFNYRPDRARQLTKLFVKKNFYFVCMTEYDKNIKTPVVFPSVTIKNSCAEIISKKYNQFHIAETEKYAHVTYFFNCGREQPFPKEKRILIPSPKVATYDKTPEMAAFKITKRAIKEINKHKFMIINFANGDMVGHTGKLTAAKKAAQAVDKCIGQIVKAAKQHTIIITADHGNCENITGDTQTSHTTNKVPFILINQKAKLRQGGLQDIAPTILKLLDLKKPKEMTGKTLFL